jgi:signal transduction histidine kinase
LKFNEIAKIKNSFAIDSPLYTELAHMEHFNPSLNLFENFDKQIVDNCELIATNSKDTFKFAHINLALGNSTFFHKNPIQSLKYFLKSEKAFEKINDVNCQVLSLLRIYSVNSNDPNSSLAIEYLNKAISIAKKANLPHLTAQALAFRGNILLEANQNIQALKIFSEIASLKNLRPRNVFINKFNMAKCYIKLGQQSQGIQLMENTLLELPRKDSKYIDYQLHIRGELIKHYLQKKKLEKVKFHFNEMKQYSNMPQINQFELHWYKNTAYLVNKAMGNYPKAIQNLEDIKTFNDSLVMTQFEQQLKATKAELESKEKLIIAENNQLKSTKIRSKQVTWFLILLSAMAILSTIFVFTTNKKLKSKNQLLLSKNAEILTAHLAGQTTERQRVAIDLHDNLGSTISSIKYSLEAIDRSKMNADELAVQENLYSLLDKAYNDVRLLSHNLLPEEFEKLGLAETLTTLVRKMNKNSKIKFELEVDENIGRLDKKVEFELYSICLELVTNIMKHSKATEASINLHLATDGQINLSVSDNGIGVFKNDSDGMGMKNINARVDAIGGSWTVKAIEGKGVVNKIVV